MRLIDADEAYEVITEAYHHTTDIQHMALRETLDKVPTVEPVKRGRWEEPKVSDDGKLQSAKCSVCGRYEAKPHMYYLRLSNYCSWCGAKMEGVKEI